MNTLSLTPNEAVAAVAHRVRRFEAQGLDGELAIQRAAAEFGIEPHKVRWCVATTSGDSAVRVSGRSRRRPCPGAPHRGATGRAGVQHAYA